MKLAYTAVDSSGRVIDDVIDADNSVTAAQTLYDKGLFVSRLEPATHSSARDIKQLFANTRGRRLRRLADFMRHLYVLLCSGVSIAQALAAVERQTQDAEWRRVVASLRKQIEDGSSLAAAMASHEQAFDPITRSLIEAGENSGNLEEMIDRIAKLKRDQLHTHRQIVGALTYPILVMTVSVGVIGLLVTVVLPRFTQLFTSLNVPLPPTTKVLIVASDWIRGYYWAMGAIVAAAIVAGWRYVHSERGKHAIDTALIRMPVISRITRDFITARIARLMGVLLGSHVGLLEALRLIRGAAGNIHYAALLERAEDATSRGNSLAQAFAGSDLINPTVYEALQNGESSGTVDTLMLTVADFMDDDNAVLLRSILNIIGPAILVVLGLFVGFVAISLFLPLFDLTAAAADGGAG